MDPIDVRPRETVGVREASRLLGTHPQTTRRWIRTGALPAVAVGSRIRIQVSDIDAILANGTRPIGPGA